MALPPNINIFIYIILFIYGICFGSFYNVVIYRMPRDISIVKGGEGRSFCPVCNHQLKAKDLVPVFSYLFLGGKCRYCGCKISIRYPLVELFTGLYFAFSYFFFGFSIMCVYMIFFWSYLFITSMIDIDFMVIIDNISIFFGVIFICFSTYILRGDVKYNFLAALIAFLVYFAIYKLAYIYYKQEAFGLGDVFLITVIAFVLGLDVVYLTIFFPFIVAVVFVIFQMIVHKKRDLKMKIPLAPFICISAFILSLYGTQMMDFIFLK